MSAASGAAKGAMQGFAIGGPWGAAIGAGIGLIQGKAEEEAREEAAKAQLEAAKKRNDALLAEAARGISEINRQRTTAFIQTNQAIQHYRRAASSEKSSLVNQYAAADVIGKSALIAKNQVDQELDAAVNQSLFNVEVQQENMNTAVDNLTNSTLNQFVDVTSEIDALYEGTDSMSQLFDIAGSAFSMYTGGLMNSSLQGAGLGNYTFKGGGNGIKNPGKTNTQAKSGIASFLGLN